MNGVPIEALYDGEDLIKTFPVKHLYAYNKALNPIPDLDSWSVTDWGESGSGTFEIEVSTFVNRMFSTLTFDTVPNIGSPVIVQTQPDETFYYDVGDYASFRVYASLWATQEVDADIRLTMYDADYQVVTVVEPSDPQVIDIVRTNIVSIVEDKPVDVVYVKMEVFIETQNIIYENLKIFFDRIWVGKIYNNDMISGELSSYFDGYGFVDQATIETEWTGIINKSISVAYSYI